MNHVVAVFKQQGVVAGLKKLADVIEQDLGIGDQFPSFTALEQRLVQSPEGQAGYAVAKDFFDDWQDGDSAVVAAEKAIAKDGGKLAGVLLADVADWLGIMDRNPVPTPSPASTEPPADSPAAA